MRVDVRAAQARLLGDSGIASSAEIRSAVRFLAPPGTSRSSRLPVTVNDCFEVANPAKLKLGRRTAS